MHLRTAFWRKRQSDVSSGLRACHTHRVSLSRRRCCFLALGAWSAHGQRTAYSSRDRAGARMVEGKRRGASLRSVRPHAMGLGAAPAEDGGLSAWGRYPDRWRDHLPNGLRNMHELHERAYVHGAGNGCRTAKEAAGPQRASGRSQEAREWLASEKHRRSWRPRPSGSTIRSREPLQTSLYATIFPMRS